jgi:GAF domain-containing protein
MTGVAYDDAELARQLEDMREQQRAISLVLRAVAGSGGVQPVLDEVVEACERLCRADYGALYLLEHGRLHVAAHRTNTAGAEWDRQHPHALDRTTAAGRAAVTREPVHIPDIREDPEYSYGGPTEYYRSLIGVPIMVEDDLIGAVVLVRREPGPFTDDHIALVQTFADQAAIAITNARLIEAVERQRSELARFLSPQVAELISSRDGEQLLAGHRAYISCLFCDLRGFTAFAETAAPEELLGVLREYHRTLGQLIAGSATLGRIGFEGRHDYGAVGPVTNLALSTQNSCAGRADARRSARLCGRGGGGRRGARGRARPRRLRPSRRRLRSRGCRATVGRSDNGAAARAS